MLISRKYPQQKQSYRCRNDSDVHDLGTVRVVFLSVLAMQMPMIKTKQEFDIFYLESFKTKLSKKTKCTKKAVEIFNSFHKID
ncbi:hypothetical protein BZG01_01865 [Labilibaculum manganireducens]|uniref:Uncharacterized protein n=1 Tax=Labilibaculum manganireducens TaxID=1940525 RepID=A0A2N3IFJ6_9BACT|nr:hypothetical protein BZG01_01865 [Labilibaculum manganireducens]